MLPDGSMTDTQMIGVQYGGSLAEYNDTDFSLSNSSTGVLLVGQFRKALDELVAQSRNGKLAVTSQSNNKQSKFVQKPAPISPVEFEISGKTGARLTPALSK
jgi:hypothetical protein